MDEMLHLGTAQRVALVVALGVMGLAVGFWVAATYATAHMSVGIGYAPLQSPAPVALSGTEMLFVWIGIAGAWGIVSVLLLGTSLGGKRPRVLR
jgi:hypothetical protein